MLKFFAGAWAALNWELVVAYLPLGGATLLALVLGVIVNKFLSWVIFGIFLWKFYPDKLPPDNDLGLIVLWASVGLFFFFFWEEENKHERIKKKWHKKLGSVKQPAILTCLEPVYGGRASIKTIKKSVFTIKTAFGHGSGFCIAHGGWALTNQHVVGDNEYFEVIINKGGKLLSRAGKCVYAMEKPDIALVKIDADMEPLRLNFDIPEEGDSIRVIGTPLDEDKEGTVTGGVISAVRETEEHGKLIQSDASVHPGNSGGPMIDEYGNVIGVTVLKHQEGGINYFIPIQAAMSGIKHKVVISVERIG